MRKRFSSLFRAIPLWLFGLAILFPISIILINSLKTSAEATSMGVSLPSRPQWGNYIEVVRTAKLGRAFLNSLVNSSLSVILCVVVSSLAAFVLARNPSRLHRSFYNYFFLGLIAPLNYVTTIGILKLLRLQNTQPGIILVWAVLGIPFAVFLYHSFIAEIPRDLDEAAILDGCGLGKLFFLVVFPLLKPVTVTVLVLNFIGAWNDFITPLFLLSSASKQGMVNSIYAFFGEHFNEWNLISADIVLSTLPILALYFAGQRYIVAGMTTGAVKG